LAVIRTVRVFSRRQLANQKRLFSGCESQSHPSGALRRACIVKLPLLQGAKRTLARVFDGLLALLDQRSNFAPGDPRSRPRRARNNLR